MGVDRSCGEPIQNAEGFVLDGALGDGRPARRLPPRRSGIGSEPDNQIRRQEPVGDLGDLHGGEPARGEGGDLFDHVMLRELGGVGAQPVLVVDEPAGDLVEPDGAKVGVTPAHPAFQPGPDLEADLGRLRLPTTEQRFRGAGVVLRRAGRQ